MKRQTTYIVVIDICSFRLRVDLSASYYCNIDRRWRAWPQKYPEQAEREIE